MNKKYKNIFNYIIFKKRKYYFKKKLYLIYRKINYIVKNYLNEVKFLNKKL